MTTPKDTAVSWTWLGPVIMGVLVALLAFVGKLMYSDVLNECADLKLSIESRSSKERVELLEKRVESLERQIRWRDRR